MDKALNQLVDMLNKGFDFMGQQLPEVAQQYLAYKSSMLWVWLWWTLPIFLFFFITCLICFIIGIVQDDSDIIWVPFGLSGVASLVFGLIIAAESYGSYKEMKKIELAPKAYLLEELLRHRRN